MKMKIRSNLNQADFAVIAVLRCKGDEDGYSASKEAQSFS